MLDVAECFALSYPFVLNAIVHYFDVKILFFEAQMSLILYLISEHLC